MNKTVFMLAFAGVVSVAVAVPEVESVRSLLDPIERKIKVDYSIVGEPTVVTIGAETNRGDNVWLPVEDANVTRLVGDVNKLVGVGRHSLSWDVGADMPESNFRSKTLRIGVTAWATNAPPDYMVVSLVLTNSIRYYTSAAAIPNGGVTNDLYKTEYLVMRKIPAANVTWRMGSPTTELGRFAARETPHEVTFSDDYYIGVYEVTQRQYQLLMNARPSNFKLDDDYATRPVEQVSYEDLRGTAANGFNWSANGHAVVSGGFIGKLCVQSGQDGFDLPTDAQWEFACRAGCGAALSNGKELDGTTTSVNLNPLARYKMNGGAVNGGSTTPAATCTAENGTAKVGAYEPNAWGIYDMHGNVWEWCLDWYQESPIGFEATVGPTSGANRVMRGASWANTADYCRSAFRGSGAPSTRRNDLGFRLACTAEAR